MLQCIRANSIWSPQDQLYGRNWFKTDPVLEKFFTLYNEKVYVVLKQTKNGA